MFLFLIDMDFKCEVKRKSGSPLNTCIIIHAFVRELFFLVPEILIDHRDQLSSKIRTDGVFINFSP